MRKMSSPSFENRAVKDFVVHQRERCFYFDISEIKKNASLLKSLEDDQIKFIFPVKSFPHASVLTMVAEVLSGFDVSNATEFNLVKDLVEEEHIIWSSSPAPWSSTHPRIIMDGAHLEAHWGTQAQRSLRVRLGELVPQHPSRFGTSLADIEGNKLQRQNVTALHFHHGQEPFNLRALEVGIEHLSLLVKQVPGITHVNLGGGFADLQEKDIRGIVVLAKKSFPAQTVVFEPGRWICGDAGLLIGKIAEINLQGRRAHATTTISRDCHLKWQRDLFEIRIQALAGSAGLLCDEVVVGGATCSENDKVGTIHQRGLKISREDLVLVRGVSGYSVAWNHSFNGIAAADVLMMT